MGDSPVVVLFHEEANKWAEHISKRHSKARIVPCHEKGELQSVLDQAEVLFTGRSFPVEAFNEAHKLRWVHVSAAGVDVFVQPGALPNGVRLTRTVGTFGPRMAEYVLAHTLAHAQRIPHALERQRVHEWAPYTPSWIAGRRMGVLGLGAIGSEIGRIASTLGMRVSGLATARRDVGGIDRVFVPEELPELLAQSHVVVLALPLTDRTHHILSRENVALLREDAILINVGRGALVDEEALIERLRDGSIAGASLDVFTDEPLPRESALWDLPNVIITPHISGPTLTDEAVDAFSENLRRYVAGEPLLLEANVERGY